MYRMVIIASSFKGGLSMTKVILANHFLKVFLFSLLLLIFTTDSPVYASPDWKEKEISKIRQHVEKVRHKYPGADEKLRQIEEKLKTGVSLKDCCYDCHKKEKIKGGSTLIK